MSSQTKQSLAKKRRFFLLLIFAALSLFACRKKLPENTTEVFIDHGDLERSFIIHQPASYDAALDYPLVLAFHGGEIGTSRNMMKETDFNTLSDQEGFFAVYPNGYKHGWADARGITKASEKGVDDVDFVREIIDYMAREYSIDTSRVFATGISNGGFMSQRLACDLSDRIAAVAPVVALYPEGATCAMDRGVSILFMVGSADPLVPYNGGTVGKNRGTVLSLTSTIDEYVQVSDCPGSPTRESLPDNTDDDTTVEIITYTDCKGNTTFQIYDITGGGHTWPGGTQYLSKKRIGPVCREFDASEVIWAFFNGSMRE